MTFGGGMCRWKALGLYLKAHLEFLKIDGEFFKGAQWKNHLLGDSRLEPHGVDGLCRVALQKWVAWRCPARGSVVQSI